MRTILGKSVCDSIEEILATRQLALVLVDMSNDFCSPEGTFARAGHDLSGITQMLPRLQLMLDVARSADVLIFHIQNTVLADGRSDSPAFLRFKSRLVDQAVYTVEGTWGWQFLPGFEPHEGEAIIRKHRPSAFVGTDLDQVLRASDIETTIVAGVATEGCVQSTAVDSLYHDYYTIVPADCVGSYNHESHESALTYLHSHVDVVSSDQVLQAWRAHPVSPRS